MALRSKPARIATFGVRYESHDDFLVGYTDHLRHGFLVLKGRSDLKPGQPIRIKLGLPNRAILYLTGSVSKDPSEHPLDEAEGTLIRLSAFTSEQTKILELCVHSPLADEAVEEANLDPLHVLVVDDSPSIRSELTRALSDAGITVRSAENGLEAISAALKHRPDLILTDVEMPVMDGWTLLRMVRARKKLAEIPVVFLTSLSDELSRLQGYRMGVDEYLPKTLPSEIVATRVRGVAKRHNRSKDEQEGLRGNLRHVRLGSVLQFLEAESKTGDLVLDRNGKRVSLRIFQGFLRDVDDLGSHTHAHERVFELLGWKDGSFEFISHTDSPELDRGAMTPTPVTYLLMEYARREDEAREESRKTGR
ncbi:MAG: response regulator [Nannocystaceae bacterium]